MKKEHLLEEEMEKLSDEFMEEEEKTGEKKKKYYMSEAEFRILDGYFKSFDRVNHILGMMEYNNPKKRREFHKWFNERLK